ncbi:methyltransferase domain-containing protein [Sphingobium boeckii]|uniref:2-polyprenyl-3-methyl-5-hydroxy-6-metoxy-1, 4-benzoquinol methylase n=1 Tax=Sphingobium boeckii TaxID=1082345 RepID=A0A7W9AEJ2_9SPHN|nr:methyltransferase domain-containing protein [Sphingobium boeckii]MBB5684072.1 2-polyprenyl-3-methyl-5-hydroxy-6-metoxy-1,4-benzoquinol methylase [Sphingobium boeckii]
MKRLAIRALEEERMDAADLDPQIYAVVMADLAKVNRITMAARPTLAFLRRALKGRTHFRLLDVGFGDGDMLRTIARWAGARGLTAQLTGIDLNPSSAPAARAHTPPDLMIEWRTGDYADLAGDGFDFVISSLVAHHMTRAQLVAFLHFMDAEAATGWFVNDLHRHGLAWHGFPLLARIMRWHEMVRHDGTLSIARAYRPHEWLPILAEAGIPDAKPFRAFPFRLCVERLR